MQEFLTANELTQMIAEPTRVTSSSSLLIDVLITSMPNSFQRTGVLSTAFSDHLPIYGLLRGPSVKPVKHRYIETRSFSRQSMEKFNADLELVPWNVVENFPDIDDKCYVWQTLFLATFNEHFPIRRKCIRQSTHPWLDKPILSTLSSAEVQAFVISIRCAKCTAGAKSNGSIRRRTSARCMSISRTSMDFSTLAKFDSLKLTEIHC